MRSYAGAALIATLGLSGCRDCDAKKDGTNDGARDGGEVDAAPATSAAPAASGGATDTPLPAEAVQAVLNPSKLPPYTGPTGSIEGTVTITGDPAPPADPLPSFTKCPEAEKTYGKLFREGPPGPGPDHARPVADVIVGAAGYDAFVPARGEARTVNIEHCALVPHVITMTFGQRLDIYNKTKDYYGPRIVQQPSARLMVAAPNADPVRLYPHTAGHLTLEDPLGHPYLKGDLWVLRQPFHDVTDLAGHYRIDGVPVGKVTVFARLPPIHEETAKPVEVLAGVVQRVDLTLHFSAARLAADADAGKADAAPASGDGGDRIRTNSPR